MKLRTHTNLERQGATRHQAQVTLSRFAHSAVHCLWTVVHFLLPFPPAYSYPSCFSLFCVGLEELRHTLNARCDLFQESLRCAKAECARLLVEAGAKPVAAVETAPPAYYIERTLASVRDNDRHYGLRQMPGPQPRAEDL